MVHRKRLWGSSHFLKFPIAHTLGDSEGPPCCVPRGWVAFGLLLLTPTFFLHNPRRSAFRGVISRRIHP